MKITILPSDQAVYKDGVSYLGLTLNSIPTDVHALQWNNNAGWIEYKNHVKPNETISALPQWANDAVVVWQQAYDAEEAAKLAAEEAAKLIVEAAKLAAEEAAKLIVEEVAQQEGAV